VYLPNSNENSFPVKSSTGEISSNNSLIPSSKSQL
jgi:hypothetical protein